VLIVLREHFLLLNGRGTMDSEDYLFFVKDAGIPSKQTKLRVPVSVLCLPPTEQEISGSKFQE